MGPYSLPTAAAPPTPAAGRIVLYAKTDNLLYWKSTDGIEYPIPPSAFFNSVLTADVALNNTANFFDGPQVAQGGVGSWLVTGTVTVNDATAGNNAIVAKLWDGTNVAASTGTIVAGATNQYATLTLHGLFTAPAGNIRVSVKDATTTAGKIVFNASGNSKDSSIVAMRVI